MLMSFAAREGALVDAVKVLSTTLLAGAGAALVAFLSTILILATGLLGSLLDLTDLLTPSIVELTDLAAAGAVPYSYSTLA